MAMLQFLAQTNVYWVEVPLHLWLDVSSQDTEAKSPPGASGGGAQEATSSPTLQIAWVRVGDRSQVRPGHAFPAESSSVLLQNLELKSQQVTLQPAQLRAVREGEKDTNWRLLLVQSISNAGHVLAEDWLPVQLVDRYADAASNYGFSIPPMHNISVSPTSPAMLVHFVHLNLGKAHVEQLEEVSEGKKRSGSSASRGAASSSDCSLLFEMAVRMAGRMISSRATDAGADGVRRGVGSGIDGEILVHTNGLPDGPVCRRIAVARRVRLLHISAPTGIYGRPVQWHQHQAGIVRMQALRRWGGVYLDTDALVTGPDAIRSLLQASRAKISMEKMRKWLLTFTQLFCSADLPSSASKKRAASAMGSLSPRPSLPSFSAGQRNMCHSGTLKWACTAPTSR